MSDPTQIPTLEEVYQAKKDMADINTFTTTTALSFTDSSGRERKTIDGVISDGQNDLAAAVASTGWFVVGEFSAGFTYTARNQVGRDADGELWSYNGPFTSGSFIVAPGTIPTEPTYTNRGDAALRTDLQSLIGIKFLRQLNGIVQITRGYHNNSGIGGGHFVWNSSRSWADHNGGTVISSQAMAVYDGTPTTLAAFLNFTPTAGTGCWERILPTIPTMMPEVFVEWFGANPLGGSDSSLSFQKAADSLGIDAQDSDKSGNITGGRGEFLFESTFDIPYNVGLEFCGANAVTFQAADSLTTPVIRFRLGRTHGFEYRKYNKFKGFRINGSYPTTNHAGQHGIDVSPDFGWSNLHMEDVWISKMGGDGIYMYQPDKSYQNGFLAHFKNVYIRECRRGLFNDGGFFGDSGFYTCNFSRCREEQIRLERSDGTPSIPGQSLDGNQNLNFYSCIFEFAAKGFYVDTGAGRLQFNFYGGHFEAFDEYAVKLSDGHGQTITNFYGTLFATTRLPIWMNNTGRVNLHGVFFEGVVDAGTGRNDYADSHAIRMDSAQQHLHIGDGCTTGQEYTTPVLNNTPAPTFYQTGFKLHTKGYTTAKEYMLQTLYAERQFIKTLANYENTVIGGNNAFIKKGVTAGQFASTIPLNTEPNTNYQVVVTTTWDSGAYVPDEDKTTTNFLVRYTNPVPTPATNHSVSIIVFRGASR